MFLNQLQQMNSAEAVSLQGLIADWARRRLDGVANWLNGRDYLEGEFSAGDLLMATVLRILRTTVVGTICSPMFQEVARCPSKSRIPQPLYDSGKWRFRGGTTKGAPDPPGRKEDRFPPKRNPRSLSVTPS
jgi:hypothetical protein